MRVETITKCRLCGGTSLAPVCNLGLLASCGVFPAASDPDPDRAPLELVRCDECGLAQLRHDFDGDELFRDAYGYRSALNESMARHLGTIARSAMERAQPKPGDLVLDIGANDGTSLSFYPATLTRVGIDPTIGRFDKYYPADILRAADFFSEQSFRELAGEAQARIVTSIAMFYDLPDPNAFVAATRAVLAPDGLWVLELSYLPAMMDANSFDTICHEHLEYYCLAQIEHLLARHDLRVFDVALNDVNGGSFQVWACRKDAPYQENTAALNTLRQREQDEGYDSGAALKALPARIEQARKDAMEFLSAARAQGKLVHGYGASTKGNTTLQVCGIDSELLPAIADRNADKHGCRTPGSNIPIISEEESRAAKPDYYFVLPWHFRSAFVQREQDFLNRGGKLVFPLPRLEIVSA